MKYDFNLVHLMLEVDGKDGISSDETLLKLARHYGKEEAWLTALKERSQGSIYRSSGKDLVTLHFQICGDEGDEKLLLDEKSPSWLRKNRMPNQWIDYWNKIEDGRVMASAGDLYQAFKLLRKMHEYGTAKQQTQAECYLGNLRKDFIWSGTESGLTCSTRLFYSQTSLDAKIVHHYRCRKPELTTETTIEVPVYRDIPIEKIVGEEKGLAYLQALLDTQDDGETIIQTVEFVSGKNKSNIFGWTANTITSETNFTRASHLERVVWLFISTDWFNLSCHNYPIDDYCGRARGVRLGAP